MRGRGEGEVRRVASAQRGLVVRGQLLAAGVTRGVIDRWLAVERLAIVHRGVYRLGHDAPAPLQRELAAALCCPGHAVLSHGSAAAVWGLWEPDEHEPVHLTLVGRKIRPRPAMRVHRVVRLHDDDFRLVDGLPVTSPARTVVDVASSPALERVISEMRFRGLLVESELRSALERAAGRRGIGRLRALLAAEQETGFTRSEAERRLRALVRRAQLPPPRFNRRLHGFELDAVWQAARVALEVDGFSAHRHRSAFERDRRRDQALAAAGYTVMRVTWRQLTGEPTAVAVRIGQALALSRAA